MNRTAVVFCLLTAAACGDNFDPPGPAARPDAGTPPQQAVIVSGTFTPGSAGIMTSLELDPINVRTRVAPNAAVGSDPMLRQFGDELFVINRSDGNNVTIINAYTFEVISQFATGPGSNPQDAAVVGSQVFVPALGTAGVVVHDRATGQTTTIDLSDLDPGDPLPECASAYAVDDAVYVACGLLDGFTPDRNGVVVVLDAATHARRATLTLSTRNPYGMFERVGSDLAIPTVDFADVSIGCVERITTGPTPAAAGCVVTNADLGGFVVSMALYAQLDVTPILWMVVSNGVFGPGEVSDLRGYDLGASELWPAPVSPAAQLLVDVAVCPGLQIVVADRTPALSGLRLFQYTEQVTTAPYGVGLRPASSHGLVCY